MPGNLAQRVVVAVVAIPAALAIVWQGGWPLALALGALGALGTRELFDMAGRQGIAPLRRTGLLSALLLPPVVYLGLVSPGVAAASWLVAGLWLVGLLSVALARRRPDQRPLAATAVTLLGVVYPSGLAAFLLAIRHLTQAERSWPGAWLVFTPLVLVWVCDTAAMAVGKAVGGPRLWPAVSPGKTWSGSAGGVVAALLTVPILNMAVLDRLGLALPLEKGLLFALVLGVVGQVGDLAESLYKREVGLKDSSSLIPGHGGVLDRLDSLYFVLPAAAALYRWFGVI
jgi:phosphatidate cytidylyltransferase